jgi:hypothetical protein
MIRSSETSVVSQGATQTNIPEDIKYKHCCENVEGYVVNYRVCKTSSDAKPYVLNVLQHTRFHDDVLFARPTFRL